MTKLDELRRHLVQLLVLTGVIVLSGCATTESAITNVESETEEVMPEKLALDGATIFSALSAELALARNEYFLALEFYLPLLREKPDLPLARRTMAIAQSVEHYPSIQEIADIWQQLEPENPAPYLAETQSLLKLGKITELTDPLRRLLTLRPDQSLEMLLLPPNTLKADDFRILAPAYKELLDEFPDSSSLELALADTYFRLKEFKVALEYASKAQRKNSSPQGYSLLAKIQYQLNGPELALNTLNTGLKEFPRDRRLVAQLAQTSAAAKQPEKALPALQSYYRSRPDDFPMVSIYARVSLESGKIETSRRLFEHLLKNDQGRDEANFYLGQIAGQEDRLETAVEYYQRVMPSDYFFAAIASISEIKQKESGNDAAIDYLETVVQNYPGLAAPYNLIASIYYDNNQHQDAIKVLTRGIEAAGVDESLLYSRALSYESDGDTDAAIRDLRQALVISPDHVNAKNALAYTLADNNRDLDEALQLVTEAYEASPASPAIIDSLGWVHYRLGNYSEAEKFLRQAFNLSGDHEIAAHLGEVLWIQEKIDEAKKVWNKGLEDNPDSEIISNTRTRLLQ